VLSSTRFDNQIISIKIRFTKVVDKESNTMIQLLNILLRKCIRSLSLQQVGRHYYDEKRKVKAFTNLIDIRDSKYDSYIFGLY